MFKHILATTALALALAAGAAAQVNPPIATNIPQQQTQYTSIYGGSMELYGGAMMQFAKATTVNSVPLSTTNVVGGEFGFRYHITDWSAIDLRYAVAYPVQSYGNAFRIKSRSQEFSFDYAWTVPTQGPFRPFLEGGAGMMTFGPSGGNNTPGAYAQKKPILIYGGGFDIPITKHIGLRLEYRGLFYRVPDFNLISIRKWNHMAEPDAMIVWHF